MATKSQGLVFTYGTTVITEVESVTGPGLKREVIDATVLSDTNRAKIISLFDAGTVGLTLKFEPDDTSHAKLLTDIIAGSTSTASIQFADASTMTYTVSGFLTGFNPSARVGEALSLDVEFTCTGTITSA